MLVHFLHNLSLMGFFLHMLLGVFYWSLFRPCSAHVLGVNLPWVDAFFRPQHTYMAWINLIPAISFVADHGIICNASIHVVRLDCACLNDFHEERRYQLWRTFRLLS